MEYYKNQDIDSDEQGCVQFNDKLSSIYDIVADQFTQIMNFSLFKIMYRFWKETQDPIQKEELKQMIDSYHESFIKIGWRVFHGANSLLLFV